MMEQSVEKHGYRRIAIGIVLFFCLFWIGKRWYDAQHPKPLNPMEIAAQITAIQDINEWEFLCVEMEEMEDTLIINPGFKPAYRFARIYKGRACLGIDMRRVTDDWARKSNDTLYLRLPDIQLLDENIVNDLSTRTFYASGEMTPVIKQELYERAKRDMRRRAMMTTNVEMARENAREHFVNLFKQLCGEKVVVEIDFIAL